MKHKRASLLVAGVMASLLIILPACSNSAQPTNSTDSSNVVSSTSDTEVLQSVDSGTKWDAETLKNDTGKTMIKSL